MYILDTSIVSNYLDRRRNFSQLVEQILSTPPEQIFISIITVEEIIQGALASIQKMRQKSSITDAYRYFEELFAALHYKRKAEVRSRQRVRQDKAEGIYVNDFNPTFVCLKPTKRQSLPDRILCPASFAIKMYFETHSASEYGVLN